MYLQFFGLGQRPFPSTPDTAAFVPTPGHEDAFNAMRDGIEQGDGFGLLLGTPGSGKTLLCRRLLESLDQSYAAAFVTNTHLPSNHALLQAFLYDLSLPYESKKEQECRLNLTDFLMEQFSKGSRTILFVDEAQHLSAKNLEELRMLTNLEGRSARALHVVLFAQFSLVETLSSPELESFRQRISLVRELAPMTDEETASYIHAHLERVGGASESIMTAESLADVFEISGGIPRRVNQLCQRALELSYRAGSGTIDSRFIHEAAATLGISAPEEPVETEFEPQPESPDKASHHAESSLPSVSDTEEDDFADELPEEEPCVVEVGVGVSEDEEDEFDDVVIDADREARLGALGAAPESKKAKDSLPTYSTDASTESSKASATKGNVSVPSGQKKSSRVSSLFSR
ncbi:Archaeal ATPase [Planctomycetes bacterium Pan216]|uniref:Archaeal ATPase n=1 Tax=Kolteria novifilia TaxID=2527975 RepID=A0A518B4Y2_9BACT|nr:Archaeal ATPase [Planctomycetes bacterium Pan216]